MADAIRSGSQHKGPWPRVSVWQGSADQTVAPSNAERIIAQWQIVHGLSGVEARRDVVEGSRHRVWCNDDGIPVLEAHDIPGMGHGTPLRTEGPQGCGASGPFMLEAGISSTRHIARFWGLTDMAVAEHRTASTAMAPSRSDAKASDARPVHHLEPLGVLPDADHAPPDGGVGAIIEKALRQQG